MATMQEALAELQSAEGAWNRRDLEAVRVRLDLFWKAKASAWSSDPATQSALTLMDADAHSIWARMEDLLAVQADSGSPERDDHASKSATAFAKAAELRMLGGASSRSVSTANRQAAASIGSAARYNATIVDDSYSAAVKSQVGTMLSGSILGIPSWAWLAGGAGLLLLFLTKD